MLLLNLTLPSAEQNLALDEALLESAEASESYPEVLRFWESPELFVVLGRGSPYLKEVNHEYCQANGVPVLRRCSGGATVVAGPGCLMYSLLLDYQKRPELRMLDVAHDYVMGRLERAIRSLGVEVNMKGTCDLVLKGRKVSGNALRCKRRFMMYHGTLLIGLSVETISHCLAMPQRQPDYREQRSHLEFLGQLPLEGEALRQAIATEWSAEGEMENWPKTLTESLSREKYLYPGWTEKI